MSAPRRRSIVVLATGAALSAAALTVAGCSGPPPAVAETTSTVVTVSVPTGQGEPGPSQGSGNTVASSPSPAATSPASTSPASENEPSVFPTTASATLYYIAQGDAGTSGPTVGCGDSAVAVTSSNISFTDPVEGALRTLLADHSRQLGQSGLDNALWQSRLSVESVTRTGGVITAHLTGTLKLGGVCDNPRVQQQLLLTAKDAAGGPVAITINGKTLSQALSLK